MTHHIHIHHIYPPPKNQTNNNITQKTGWRSVSVKEIAQRLPPWTESKQKTFLALQHKNCKLIQKEAWWLFEAQSFGKWGPAFLTWSSPRLPQLMFRPNAESQRWESQDVSSYCAKWEEERTLNARGQKRYSKRIMIQNMLPKSLWHHQIFA